MDGRLNTAAEQGNIDMLYGLIRGNPKVLDDIDEVPFIETPLHIAASGGKISFAMEIVRLKPSFSRKLNKDGFSPMHLALFNGQNKMLLRFVDHESALVRVQGKEGKTPLHHVAEQGDVNLLAEFLGACPTSIQDVTVDGETALHIAVKNRNVEALDVLLGGLLTACSNVQKKLIIINRQDIQGKTALHIAIATNQVQVVKLLLKSGIDVNCKDDQGKTVLHIATATNQVEMVKLLAERVIDVNAMDDEGQTALDFLNPQNRRQVGEILLRPKPLVLRLQRWFSNYFLGPKQLLMSNLSSKDRIQIFIFRSSKYMDNDTRNVILVLATLILTATYQATLSPPGGLWQEDSTRNSRNNNITGITNTTTNIHYDNYKDGGSSTSQSEAHIAGTTIMYEYVFLTFYILNSLTFLASTLVVFCLLPTDHMSWLLTFPLYLFSVCYLLSLAEISPDPIFLHVFFIWLLAFSAACFCLFLLSKYSRKFNQTTTS